MDHKCRFNSLGNSSTASGSSDHRETIGPSYSQAVGTSSFDLPVVLFSLFTHLSLFTLLKVKSSLARSLPVENLLPKNVGSIINYCSNLLK